MISKYPFRNLVFKGGGMKALAYHGALRVLEEERILTQVERVAGTSAGALLATMLSMRLTTEEIVKKYQEIDYTRIAAVRSDFISESGDQSQRFYTRELTRLVDNVDAVYRFIQRYGWYENDLAHEWIQSVVADHCAGDGRATFADFNSFGYCDLYIVTTNLSKHCIQIFSTKETPDVPVADAVLMSSSLPFYFESVQYDGREFGSGDYYADGGLLYNYPIQVFDSPEFKHESRHFVHGVNWETLGFRLFTPDDLEDHHRKITSLVSYVESVLETIIELQDTLVMQSAVDRMRTISISNCGVSTTDLQISPDLEDPKYADLFASGQLATREYLNRYRLPTDRFFSIKAKFVDLIEKRF